jgi:rRNA-processing protein FCF1
MKLMLDTNILNAIADGKLNSDALQIHELYITDVQLTELKKTQCEERITTLLKCVQILNPTQQPSRGVWDDSSWDRSEFSESDGLYKKLESRIKELDAQKKKKSRETYNQSRDARIADAAIRHKMILVTNDETLRIAAIEFGCQGLTLTELSQKTN